MAFDSNGNLYVANLLASGSGIISMFAGSLSAGGVVIRSSLPARPMSLGGADSAVAALI